jgi:hypothetical protein
MMPTIMPNARRPGGVMVVFFYFLATHFIAAGDGATPMAGLGGSI